MNSQVFQLPFGMNKVTIRDPNFIIKNKIRVDLWGPFDLVLLTKETKFLEK